MLELNIYNFAIQHNVWWIKFRIEKKILACVHTCVKINNNAFKLLCGYIVILCYNSDFFEIK